MALVRGSLSKAGLNLRPEDNRFGLAWQIRTSLVFEKICYLPVRFVWSEGVPDMIIA